MFHRPQQEALYNLIRDRAGDNGWAILKQSDISHYKYGKYGYDLTLKYLLKGGWIKRRVKHCPACGTYKPAKGDWHTYKITKWRSDEGIR